MKLVDMADAFDGKKAQICYVVNKTEDFFLPYSQSFPTRFAQNDQPVIHRGGGGMTGYTTCFARKVIMTSQANTPKRQRRTARFF